MICYENTGIKEHIFPTTKNYFYFFPLGFFLKIWTFTGGALTGLKPKSNFFLNNLVGEPQTHDFSGNPKKREKSTPLNVQYGGVWTFFDLSEQVK